MRRRARAAAIALCAMVAAATVAAAAGKSYSADRFDSRIRALPGGDLEVTETVVFRFEGGTFDHVFREISERRTDGIEFVSASMDGRTFPPGDGVGRIAVTGTSKRRVRWQFPAVADSTHTFVLAYIARGIVRQESGGNILAWRAIPSEHEYRIGSSTIEFELPERVARGAKLPVPHMEWHRVEGPADADTHLTNDGATVIARATARDIRSNGWIEARFDLPDGSIVTTAPGWQQTEMNRRALAPRWMIAASLILGAGLILLVGLRQQYDPPPGDAGTPSASPVLPDALPPGLVGPILGNGRTSLHHAMATLFGLAGRGIVTIEEGRRGVFGQRHFDVRRLATGVSSRHTSMH